MNCFKQTAPVDPSTRHINNLVEPQFVSFDPVTYIEDAVASGTVVGQTTPAYDDEQSMQINAAIGFSCDVGLTSGLDRIDRMIASHGKSIVQTAVPEELQEERNTADINPSQTKEEEEAS